MTDREDFLSRWSRRKRDADKESAPEEVNRLPPVESVPPVTEEPPSATQAHAAEPREAVEEKEKDEDEPEFDLSKLPSIESITAETDIRPFLAAGVPVSLRQAALRRVWVADPKIRDFIGIAENQWDFTPGGNAPGFDFSPPTGDIQRMVAEIFGGGQHREPDKVAESEDELSAQDEPESVRRTDSVSQPGSDQLDVNSGAEDRDGLSGQDANEVPSADVPKSGMYEEDVASQNNDAKQNESFRVVARRSHGGAMPK